MKRTIKKWIIAIILGLLAGGHVAAQSPSNYNLKAVLVDSLTKAPIEFAVIAVYEGASTTVTKFAISDRRGVVEILGIRRGEHTVKIDLMGYHSRTQTIAFTGREAQVDLGQVLMREDVNLLEAAMVTALGNPIVVKQDTIQFNASAFRTSENDMLEELLKKLPGVEVDADGKITVNGREISRVMIDGKSFFTDDPTIATRNLPARMVERVNVVNRRSDQARFTGIDDGNEEFVLDLSIRPGMMNGWFGNMSAGYGTKEHYQAAGMVGRFQGSDQLMFIGNVNNTNNRVFNDAMGGMMQGMRGGMPAGGGGGFGGAGVRFGGGMMTFGGSGLTTQWNAGTNMNSEFFDKKLKVGGNYFYGGTETIRESRTDRQNFLPDSTFFYNQEGKSLSRSESHRVGMEIDYSLNDRNSILFRPNATLGYGRFDEESKYSNVGSRGTKINDGKSLSFGDSDSRSTSGELLLRHRFEKPGNTISLSFNYSLSESSMDGYNLSGTNVYGERERKDSVNQNYTQKNTSYSLSSRLSYTQPLGNNYFLELAYRYRYSQNNSDRESFNINELTGKYDLKDVEYSNILKNTTIEQQAEINLRSNQEKYSYTVGFSALPSYISSVGTTGGVDRDFARHRFNFAPRVDFRYRFSQNSNLRIEYNGRTNQPSLTQLQPVKDNSNPLNVREGNLNLTPEFSNRFTTEFRNTNMSTFRTISVRSDINYTLNTIITKREYIDGVQYSMPVNEGTSFSGNLNLTYSTPIARSKFNVMSSTGVRSRSNYGYTNGVKNHTTTFGLNETLRFNYRGDKLDIGISGNAAYSKSWYTIQQNGVDNTWNNRIRADMNWTLPWGLSLLSDLNHIFYIGYPEGFNQPSTVWNASVTKLLFKNMGTLAVRIFDILKEANSISYNVQDSYIETMESNVLTQYVMFSF
ncbi:MAG: outer membrane beta-barrel family protein, partial [Bacteroidales bacterium]|nr:outer membrane beta-barrel family protein [Bacteroidales bacterium]